MLSKPLIDDLSREGQYYIQASNCPLVTRRVYICSGNRPGSTQWRGGVIIRMRLELHIDKRAAERDPRLFAPAWDHFVPQGQAAHLIFTGWARSEGRPGSRVDPPPTHGDHPSLHGANDATVSHRLTV